MSEFLKFFEQKSKNCPIHLEIGYNKVVDCGIHIYKRGCGDCGKDLEIVNVSGCDMELCFAKEHVELKEWLLKNEGGYLE